MKILLIVLSFLLDNQNINGKWTTPYENTRLIFHKDKVTMMMRAYPRPIFVNYHGHRMKLGNLLIFGYKSPRLPLFNQCSMDMFLMGIGSLNNNATLFSNLSTGLLLTYCPQKLPNLFIDSFSGTWNLKLKLP